MLNGCIILELGVIIYILKESSIALPPVHGYQFFLDGKVNNKSISVTHVATIQLWPW